MAAVDSIPRAYRTLRTVYVSFVTDSTANESVSVFLDGALARYGPEVPCYSTSWRTS